MHVEIVSELCVSMYEGRRREMGEGGLASIWGAITPAVPPHLIKRYRHKEKVVKLAAY